MRVVTKHHSKLSQLLISRTTEIWSHFSEVRNGRFVTCSCCSIEESLKKLQKWLKKTEKNLLKRYLFGRSLLIAIAIVITISFGRYRTAVLITKNDPIERVKVVIWSPWSGLIDGTRTMSQWGGKIVLSIESSTFMNVLEIFYQIH